MAFYVYLVASKKRGTLYIGMTDDLAKRIWEHKEKLTPDTLLTDWSGMKSMRAGKAPLSANAP